MCLSRCAGTSSLAVQLRALTRKSVFGTAACQELEIWYRRVSGLVEHIFVILYDLMCAHNIRSMFPGTSSIWWVWAEGGGAGAQPEVCVCCSSLQQPGQATGQHHRRVNIPTAGILAGTTPLRMGSLGTGTSLSPHHPHHLLGPGSSSGAGKQQHVHPNRYVHVALFVCRVGLRACRYYND